MWLYLHFRRTVMATRVLAAGIDTSNSSSRRLIILALMNRVYIFYAQSVLIKIAIVTSNRSVMQAGPRPFS